MLARLLSVPLSGNNRWQVVHTRASLLLTVQFGNGHRAVMFYDREGNRRSGIALRLRLQWFISRPKYER